MMYRIKTVAELTGIPRNTILAWERRYNLMSPDRQANGYRTYSAQDVSLLHRLKSMVNQGYKVSEAVDLVRGAAFGADQNVEPRTAADLRGELLTALMELDREAADGLAAQLSSLSVQRALDEVYLPLLREVGERWHRGEANIAQEHYASAWVRERLSAMFNALGGGPVGAALAMCAGYPDEPHELGLFAVAIKLALRGLRVDYLGANLPTADLIAVAKRRKPAIVMQSMVLPRPKEEVLRQARLLREALPTSTQLVIGGPGVAALAHDGEEGLLFCPSFEDLVRDFDWSGVAHGR